MPPPPHWPDHHDQDDRNQSSRTTTTRLKLALAVGALLLLGAIVFLHVSGVLTPVRLH